MEMRWKNEILHVLWFNVQHFVIQFVFRKEKVVKNKYSSSQNLGYFLNMFLLFWKISGWTFQIKGYHKKDVSLKMAHKLTANTLRGRWVFAPIISHKLTWGPPCYISYLQSTCFEFHIRQVWQKLSVAPISEEWP